MEMVKSNTDQKIERNIVMENNENLVTEAVAENVEQTTEETPRTYSEAEFNEAVNKKVGEVMGGKIARKEAKIRKEYERKYGDLVETLKAGTGKESVEELNDTFAKFYESKGIKINKTPQYSDEDIEILSRAEADEIIRGGFDEVVEEADRLKDKGVANMTAKEKALFRKLTDYVRVNEQSQELARIGVTEDVYNGDDFKSFAAKFNPNTPITDIYDIYAKTKPQKEHKSMGSMKHQGADSGVKDYYTPEEIERLTEEDLDDPRVWDAVRKSMTGR
jgi:hypothetical protein